MAKRGGFPGDMGGMNQANMMKQVQKMQRQLQEQQEALENSEFVGTAGGGAVSVTMTGKREIKNLTIDPEVVDPEDVEMLQDLIVAAFNEAQRKLEEMNASSLDKLTGGLGGLGGNFGGLF